MSAKYLQQWGIIPERASKGLKALHKVRQGEYDLVLMNLPMLVMDGFEATSRISKPGLPYSMLSTIALTADAVADVKERAHRAGKNELLTKSYSPADFHRSSTGTTHIQSDHTVRACLQLCC